MVAFEVWAKDAAERYPEAPEEDGERKEEAIMFDDEGRLGEHTYNRVACESTFIIRLYSVRSTEYWARHYLGIVISCRSFFYSLVLIWLSTVGKQTWLS